MKTAVGKLRLKPGVVVFVANVPASLNCFIDELRAATAVVDRLPAEGNVTATLVFATRQADINDLVPLIAEQVPGDAAVWFAYPKASSKKYRCEFHRDSGWAVLGQHGFEGVRQIAIDDDWSALRFRRAEYIKQLTRAGERALSAAGKAKLAS